MLMSWLRIQALLDLENQLPAGMCPDCIPERLDVFDGLDAPSSVLRPARARCGEDYWAHHRGTRG